MALKFKFLEAYAAGTGARLPADSEPKQLGYYAWARLGYDGDIQSLMNSRKDGTDEEFATIADFYQRFGNVKKISEMMLTEERRDWWRNYGGSFDAKFDLRSSSPSRRVLTAYVAEKSIRSKKSQSKQRSFDGLDAFPFSTKHQDFHVAQRFGESPDQFVPEDEAILDQIWDAIGREAGVATP